MKRAARACVHSIDQYFADVSHFLVYCGSGNNAGDGYLIIKGGCPPGFSLMRAKQRSVLRR